jgi:Uncharacterized protein conserved in bacteria
MTVPPARKAGSPGGDDPWAAFGYLVAGVLFYGVLGWLLSVWTGQSYWVPIGLLVGLALGMFLVFARYRFREEPQRPRRHHRPARPDRDRTPEPPESQ